MLCSVSQNINIKITILVAEIYRNINGIEAIIGTKKNLEAESHCIHIYNIDI